METGPICTPWPVLCSGSPSPPLQPGWREGGSLTPEPWPPQGGAGDAGPQHFCVWRLLVLFIVNSLCSPQGTQSCFHSRSSLVPCSGKLRSFCAGRLQPLSRCAPDAASVLLVASFSSLGLLGPRGGMLRGPQLPLGDATETFEGFAP